MPKTYFDPDSITFYRDDLHSSIPKSAKEIDDAIRMKVLAEVANGKVLGASDDGSPVAKEYIHPSSASQIANQCTPAQGLVALFALKQITEDDVQAAIDSITDPVQKYTAQIAFKRAVTWDRNSQTMQTMAQLLSLSEKDLDELFEYAVTIQA